jgi:L-lactate dehydrogenase complex protein LldF
MALPGTSRTFPANVRRALADSDLQSALQVVETNFIGKRAKAKKGLPEFDQLRDAAVAIKNRTLENLDFYLEAFERKVIESGGQVHWCRTPAEARATILELCRSVNAETCTKGKSMVAEEIGLNPYLLRNGVVPVETDLGEYIIQLADEPPSHIIAPAVHMTKARIGEIFHRHHMPLGKTERLTDGQAMVTEAREILRQKFLDADVGITGANFLIAETGSTVIVTNEGNGDLTQTLPKLHIVIASIEKVVPTLEDASTILRVLARSATGQEMSVYTTFSTGPRRDGDLDGPGGFHVVLLDNGRTAMLGTPLQDALRCIRCGACLNHCPIYQAVGGHAYGWVYAGPIGAALTPHFLGVEAAHHLPAASTLCGRCEDVCPMRIPLPDILRHWRERAFTAQVDSPIPRLMLKAWAWFARHPAIYHPLARLGVGALAWLGQGRGRIAKLPGLGAWTASRDFPAPQGDTFQAQWRRR